MLLSTLQDEIQGTRMGGGMTVAVVWWWGEIYFWGIV